MSADWALGSLVLAIILFLLNPRLALLMRTVIATCLQWFHFQPALCASSVWNDLPDNICFHFHRNCLSNAPGYGNFRTLPDAHGLEDFLQYFSALRTHQNARVVKKPVALDILRTYFNTDFKTILMCFISTIEAKGVKNRYWKYRYDSFSNSYIFEFGKSFLKLKKHENYFEARINAPCENCETVTQRTKMEIELIITSGYPPWYQKNLKNEHGVTSTFPQLSNRNIGRAGWIVAIGLGDASALPYFAASFGDFRPLSSWNHHRGPGQGSYWQGCQYLRKFISTQIGKAFPHNELVQVTNRSIKRMLKDHTGSGTGGSLENTPLKNAMCKERPDIERLEAIILPVLAGAIRGLHKVLQHLNSGSSQLRGDFNDLIAENLPVFIRE